MIDKKSCSIFKAGMIRYEIVVGGLVIALLAVGGGIAATRGGGTVRVEGEGRVMVKAETVAMIVSQVSVVDGVEAAISQSEREVTKLMAAAKAAGGDGAEIKKGVLQTTVQTGGKTVVANAISIKGVEANRATTLIKEMYAGGATGVSEVTFGVEDEKSLESKARKAAMEEAKTRAVEAAKMAGRSLGGVKMIEEETPMVTTAAGETGKTGEGGEMVTAIKKVVVVYELR